RGQQRPYPLLCATECAEDVGKRSPNVGARKQLWQNRAAIFLPKTEHNPRLQRLKQKICHTPCMTGKLVYGKMKNQRRGRPLCLLWRLFVEQSATPGE